MAQDGGAKLHKVLPRVETDAAEGLSPEQAAERLHNGYANVNPDTPERTVGQIVRENVFTYFNLIFAVLAVCLVAVGSYKDLTFMPIVLINCVIGIVQELRSRAVLRKMTIITSPRATVVRGGAVATVKADDTVLDDIVIFSSGSQIYADGIVLEGECRVNEALVTGEADEIMKSAGDTLFSGSFVVSGECRARLDKVGRDSFVSTLTLEAKKSGKKQRSEMMHALTRLVQVIGVAIIPLGASMLYQNRNVLQMNMQDSIVTTVTPLIGMIPEGLYLLVSVALAVSVTRLAKMKTLVHEMGCIETLARVDVLCVDKTGTITEPFMQVRDTVLLCEDRFSAEDVAQILTDYASAQAGDNETMLALKRQYDGMPSKGALKVLPFSSSAKYSGVKFTDESAYLLGAPEKILLAGYDARRDEIESYSARGFRVLLLAMYDGEPDARAVTGGVFPVALVLLTNKIRDEAPATFKFFAEQGVTIKVISGDNPATVSQIALEAGIAGADKYIDAGTLTTERKLRRAVEEYTVFGRVTPDQKRKLVRALKHAGHTVAMTGDGVNDVLALKDADCSIAMASGSEVACHIAQLVLLDSNFAAMPRVVLEGRRVINNIERSSALFLVKNIFSFILAALKLTFALTYPMSPSQLSLFNVMFIGIPSFVLALEPNKARVHGRFLRNVILNALPAGLTDVGALLTAMFLAERFGIAADELGTMATILCAFVGFLMLLKLTVPLTTLRRALIIAMLAGFTLGAIVFSGLFNMVALSGKAIGVTALLAALTVPLMLLLTAAVRRFTHGRARQRA
ncbi:MAG: HAD-IC family P-type ATPase [Oscillospiraceae bacterium]|jgi:cation-transporting ATPase E|nr:HAD-IC family P-type ATPase [Oscillospiraceae bacterium]